MIEIICKNCSKKFKARKDKVKKGEGIYCSRKCSNTLKYHPNWKGGRIITLRGYIKIKSPNHPYANNLGYVPEHRLIMEKYIKRFLLPTEFVHHKNGITNDNRLENLEIISRSEHSILHCKLYWTPENKKHQSELKKGIKFSLSHRKALSNARKGMKLSFNHRKNIGIASKIAWTRRKNQNSN